MLILRLVLCLSVVHRVESALRSVTKSSASAILQHTSNLVKEKKQDPQPNDKDLEAIMKEADSLSKGVAKATDDLKKLQNKGKEKEKPKDEEEQPKDEEKNPKRKAMDPVEAFRAMMCWGRKNLLDHEKCMEWMTKNCRKETTGEGYCKKLRRYVKSKCRRGSQKACDYAKDLGIDMVTDTEKTDENDLDGDGIPDNEDEFPDNPVEWKDSDKDGVGDNSDRWPKDPSCADEGDICGGGAPSPAGPVFQVASSAPSPGPAPDGLSMDASMPLPSQGFDEFSDGAPAAHTDGVTMTSDWREEFGEAGHELTSVKSICDQNPNHAWCKLMKSKAARQAYAAHHP